MKRPLVLGKQRQKLPAGRWSAKPWAGYAVAISGTGLAVAVRWAIGLWVGEIPPLPFITFYPVAIAAALVGGTGAGVAATIMGALAADVFIFPPIGRVSTPTPGQAVGLGLFLGINFAISVVAGRLRAAHLQTRLQTAALEATANATVITDCEGVIQWVNPAFEQLTGYPAQEALGQNPRMLNSGRHGQGFFKEMWATVLAGRTWHGELVNRRKDGSLYNEEMTITPVKNRRGRITHFIAVKQDVTVRKQAEEALTRSKEDLERLVGERTARLRETIEDLEAFSYSIIHDMRAPLRAMQNFAALAQESCAGCVQGEGLDYFRRIRTASNRLDSLITGALNYSKVVREQFAVTPVDLGGLLRGIVESYPNLDLAAVEIRIDFGSLVVLGNESALTQVFSNLLGNGVKFVAPGIKPRIRIWAEPAQTPGLQLSRMPATESQAPGSGNPRVRIWVEDNGIGIPAQAHERIFGLFERMHREDEYPGTGIGLTIVRKAVERMGGHVGVESEPGKGSRFWIELSRGTPAPAHPPTGLEPRDQVSLAS